MRDRGHRGGADPRRRWEGELIEFIVPGKPVGKQRARVVKGRAYTPDETRAYESWVALCARCADVEIATGKVAIQIIAYMPDLRRRDLDNVIKSIMDGLNGVAY